jgi:hypothetical protein
LAIILPDKILGHAPPFDETHKRDTLLASLSDVVTDRLVLVDSREEKRADVVVFCGTLFWRLGRVGRIDRPVVQPSGCIFGNGNTTSRGRKGDGNSLGDFVDGLVVVIEKADFVGWIRKRRDEETQRVRVGSHFPELREGAGKRQARGRRCRD